LGTTKSENNKVLQTALLPLSVRKQRATLIAAILGLLIKIALGHYLPSNSFTEAVSWIIGLNIALFSWVVINAMNSAHERAQINDSVRDLNNAVGVEIDKLDAAIGKANIVVLADEDDALKYCTKAMPAASEIKTTILRFRDGVVEEPPQYQSWIEAKKQFVAGGNVLVELVSSHLSDADEQSRFIEENNPTSKYNVHYLDDEIYPAIQLSILYFPASDKHEEHKVVVFGGSVAGAPGGPYFKTSSEGVVELFERYFNLLRNVSQPKKGMTALWNNVYGKVGEDQLKEFAKKIIASAGQRKYDARLNGTWIYALRNHPTIQDIYGIIKIKHTDDYLIASADVFFVDGRPRGRWWSRDINYDHEHRLLEIIYDIFLYDEDPATCERVCLSKNNYLGVLVFEIGDQMLTGRFGNLSVAERGEISVARLADSTDADDAETLPGIFYEKLKKKIKPPQWVKEGQCYFTCTQCGH
jgi:hypothetical protein